MIRSEGIGIIGTGVWQAPPVCNDELEVRVRPVRDPFKSVVDVDEDGQVHASGLVFPAAQYPRTLEAMRRVRLDPFRGTRHRRHFPEELLISDAEADVARQALDDAGIPASRIGAVLVFSFHPDVMQPRNAVLVAHKLGIVNALVVNTDTACSSSLSQLGLADSLVSSGAADYVLCVQSSPYSWLNDDDSAVQEGDLATAFVVGGKAGSRHAQASRADGENFRAITLHHTVRDGRAEAGERQREYRFEWDKAQQHRVHGSLGSYARIVVSEALATMGWDRAEVDVFIPQQSAAWIPVYLSEHLGFTEKQTFHTFEEYCNCNSPGLTASWWEAAKAGRIEPGTKVLIFAAGAGHSYIASAVQW